MVLCPKHTGKYICILLLLVKSSKILVVKYALFIASRDLAKLVKSFNHRDRAILANASRYTPYFIKPNFMLKELILGT